MTYSVKKILCEISNYVLVNVKEIMWRNIKGVFEEVDTKNGEKWKLWKQTKKLSLEGWKKRTEVLIIKKYSNRILVFLEINFDNVNY